MKKHHGAVAGRQNWVRSPRVVPGGERPDEPLDPGARRTWSYCSLSAALRAHGTPTTTLEVVALCEEESSRFPANFFGTRAMLGLVAPGEPEVNYQEMLMRDAHSRSHAALSARPWELTV